MTESKRFVVVGAGGTGGHLCRGLAPMLEFSLPGSVLLIVDGDSFEPKNAERQDFSDLGNKAVVRASELQPMYPRTFIVPDERWVVEKSKGIKASKANSDSEEDEAQTKEISARDLIGENDIIYTTVDNFAARKAIFDAARDVSNIDVFTGGNDDEYYGSIYHYQRRDGKDITDHPAVWHDEFVNPPDKNPGEMSCQERAEIEGGTQLLATNMAVAALLLARTHKVVLNGGGSKETEIMFDLGLGMSQSYDRVVQPELITAIKQK